MKYFKYIFGVYVLILFNPVQCSLSDYINSIGSYFGFQQGGDDAVEIYDQNIPYEVSTIDDKFLAEAAQLTGVALSELDSCQQRVVLKLKSDCSRMNDEQLAKMAVHLLNCQSSVEGRQIYPCTDEMSIKECTTRMDSDTWTSYHLMSNRARAVCYSIRQNQFRGLAEHTVNRLMDAARSQLRTLGEIVDNQEDLRNLAESTYDTLNKGHKNLLKQQQDIETAQFHGQLAIEDNIRRLVDEKRLILETHDRLVQMTKSMQEKIGHSLQQLDHQSQESKVNHKELIGDLLKIQEKAHNIFKKIDESSHLLLKQNEDFKRQYEFTLKNLEEVNRTVHNLVTLVGGTRQALEERLTWITTALGGTDMAIERLYLVLWHSAFMLLAMLTCAFLSVRASTRFVVATLPPLNLAVALYGEQQYLNPVLLCSAIAGFVLSQTIITSLLTLRPVAKKALPWIKNKVTTVEGTQDGFVKSSPKEFVSSTNHNHERIPYPSELESSSRSEVYADDNYADYTAEATDSFKEDFNLTPPVSRNGHYNSVRPRSRSRSNTPLYINTRLRGSCGAKTRAGTPCKLSSLPGRDYCYRHQTGDSVMG
ncbi:hypothetical protein NQ318_007864 [Aromia moschata]|uniref:Protein brambleberry n=1 Tax=Aromia moschata TaxID=1265417 RepID=A0AAV8XMW8_9CUCU|nr:hypothetical protein NQ318_007864 [Aromia moschata]